MDGQDLGQLSEQALDRFRARKVGYVFQTFHLLPGLTVLENVETAVTFAGGKDYQKARQVLEEMDLGDRLSHYPSQLSVGQRQRVAVARAVVNSPPLILADEPTANLDSVRADAVIKLLRETCRARGAALVVVTHDQPVVEGFDRVVEFAQQFGVAE